MSKSFLGPLFCVLLIGCDRANEPRVRTSMGAGRFGDFVLPMRDIAIPSSMRPNETFNIAFRVDGADPCSYSQVVSIIQARATYIYPWGVTHPGAECRETTFPLSIYYPVGTADSRAKYPLPSTDPVYERVIVCLPNGGFRQFDVLLELPWSTRPGTGPKWPEKTRTIDEAVCTDFAKWARAG
jgi:hypothetical protein